MNCLASKVPIVLWLVFWSGHAAYAAGAGVLPVYFVIKQLVNFAAFGVLLCLLLRRTVKEHFAAERSKYWEHARKVERLVEQAQKARDSVARDLEQLKSRQDETRKQSAARAEELKRQLISQAKQESQQLLKNAQNTLAGEFNRAKLELYKETAQQAIKGCKERLRCGASVAQQLPKEQYHALMARHFLKEFSTLSAEAVSGNVSGKVSGNVSQPKEAR